MGSTGYGNKFIAVGDSFTWEDLQGKEVVLKVIKANGDYDCSGCWFYKRQHCPESWACGKFRRKDKTKVIFIKQGE